MRCRALRHEDVVLWIDSDIVSAPQELLPRMMASNLDIITPNCYFLDRSWPKWRQKHWYFDYNVFQGGQLAGNTLHIAFVKKLVQPLSSYLAQTALKQ